MILVRHGESHFNRHFNVTREDPGIADPGLTPEGLEQARDAARLVASLSPVTRILASPYWRTLQTAEALAEILDLEVVIEPIVREHAFFTCDIGTPRSTLSSRWPSFSFGALDERWWPGRGETEEEVRDRGEGFRQRMLASETWRGTVVVTHWGFIRSLTGQRVANGAVLGFDPQDGGAVLHRPPARALGAR
jgi:broad specificity phosphatase PhoE